MLGRATETEEEHQRRENLRIEIPDYKETIERPNGNIETSNIPKQLTKTPEVHETNSTTDPITTQEAESLETLYSTLFQYGVFDLLDHLGKHEEVYKDELQEDMPDLVEIAYNQELIKKTGSTIQTSNFGEQRYENWNRFRNYLSREQRYEKMVSYHGEQEMPDILNSSLGLDTDLDSFLRNPESFRNRWQNNYSPEQEFRDITSVLCSENLCGEALKLLYQTEKQEVAYPEDLSQTGLNGLTKNGHLNFDGERLLQTVKIDQLYL